MLWQLKNLWKNILSKFFNGWDLFLPPNFPSFTPLYISPSMGSYSSNRPIDQICGRRLFVYIRLMKERMFPGVWSKGRNWRNFPNSGFYRLYTVPKIRFMYSQKWNCAASFPALSSSSPSSHLTLWPRGGGGVKAGQVSGSIKDRSWQQQQTIVK